MKFTGHKVSIVLNFVCYSKQRLETIQPNASLYAKYLGNYPVLVNYNEEEFLPDVSALFKNAGIKDLHFQNDLDKNWSKVTTDLVNMTDSPYVLYLTEDMMPAECLADNYFKTLVEEFEKYNCSHMALSRISKYNNAPYLKHYHTKTPHLLICESDNSPFPALSLDALYKRDFLTENLKKVWLIKGGRAVREFERLFIRNNGGHKRRINKKITNCVPVKNILIHKHGSRKGCPSGLLL